MKDEVVEPDHKWVVWKGAVTDQPEISDRKYGSQKNSTHNASKESRVRRGAKLRGLIAYQSIPLSRRIAALRQSRHFWLIWEEGSSGAPTL